MSSFNSDQKRFWRSVVIGLLTAILTTVILTCLCGFILKMTAGIPYGLIHYIMIAIEGIGALVGAYTASVLSKSRGLINGLICGSLMLVILFACGFSVADNDIGILSLIRAAVLLLFGVIGGIAGVNKKEKVKIK